MALVVTVISVRTELNFALPVTNLAFCQATHQRPRARRGPAGHPGPFGNKGKKGSEILPLLEAFVWYSGPQACRQSISPQQLHISYKFFFTKFGNSH